MKVCKLAIITLYGNYNYGNKLQNYAVEQIFMEHGIEVATIDYGKIISRHKAKKIFHILTGYHFSKNKELWISLVKKEKLLKNFSNRHLHVKKQTRIERLKKLFDFFCVGSDQVWNPSWFSERTKHLMLLDFVESKKKMTLSASFGVEELQQEWKNFFKERLMDFKKISVREESAEKIVKELCDVEVETYIDPTLMFDSQKWESLAQKPVEYSEEYIRNSIVIYFLGDIEHSDIEKMQAIAEKNNLHIITLDRNDIGECIIPSLEEWLYCIGNARLVITDSFHGSVFSFLFDRNLLIYKRKDGDASMFSRLENLMKKFKLNDRLAENCSGQRIMNHDYSMGYCILEDEREKLRKYIESVI